MSSFTSYTAAPTLTQQSSAAEVGQDYGFDLTPDTVATIAKLTPAARREFLTNLDRDAAAHQQKIVEMTQHVENMERGIASYERTAKSKGAYRLTVGAADGRPALEVLNQHSAARNNVIGGFTHVDLTTMDVSVGGTTITAKQASDFLEDGTLSRAQYKDAVETSARRLQPGFKMPRKVIGDKDHPWNHI